VYYSVHFITNRLVWQFFKPFTLFLKVNKVTVRLPFNLLLGFSYFLLIINCFFIFYSIVIILCHLFSKQTNNLIHTDAYAPYTCCLGRHNVIRKHYISFPKRVCGSKFLLKSPTLFFIFSK
jgi:predicted permease